MKQLTYTFLLLTLTLGLSAQELHFSQFYNAPLHMSPSNAGAFDGTRIVANYRDQWPGIANTYTTYMLSVDHYFEKQHSGVGFLASRDQSGDLSLNTSKFAGMYSFDFKAYRNLHVKPGLEFSYSLNGINYANMRLREQIVLGAPVASSMPDFTSFNYYDAAASIMVYSPTFRFSFKADHLARPSQVQYSNDLMPFLFNFYGTYDIGFRQRILSGESRKLIPAFNLSFSSNYRQLDLGVITQRDDLQIGLFYRGIPSFKSYAGSDALILSLGYTYNNIKFTASHDFTISGLSQSSNGANEVSLIILFENKFNSKKHYTPRKCVEPTPKKE